jgi:hypothetical protein
MHLYWKDKIKTKLIFAFFAFLSLRLADSFKVKIMAKLGRTVIQADTPASNLSGCNIAITTDI